MAARFSPPKDKTDLIRELTGDDSPFPEYKDLLFFAAVVGYHMKRREPLKGKGEGIRWETMCNREGTQELTDMIAAIEYPDDPSILTNERLPDRIAILEEYANGGLSVLRERWASAGPVGKEVLFVTLIREALDAGAGGSDEMRLIDRLLKL